jgi:hypothetical protein
MPRLPNFSDRTLTSARSHNLYSRLYQFCPLVQVTIAPAFCYATFGFMRQEMKFDGSWAEGGKRHRSACALRLFSSGNPKLALPNYVPRPITNNQPPVTDNHAQIAAFLIDTLPIRITLKPLTCIIGTLSNRHSPRPLSCRSSREVLASSSRRKSGTVATAQSQSHTTS